MSELQTALENFTAAANRLNKLAERTRRVMRKLDQQADSDIIVEAWHLERKVSIYSDCVLRVWGENIDNEMSEEPRTMESVQSALDWLYGAERRGPDL